MLVDLGKPDVGGRAEALALLTARETLEHARQTGGVGGLSLDAWVPYQNGLPAWDSPPGATWIQMVALQKTSIDESAMDDFVWRARLVSVGAGLVVIAMVFWAAHSIGGNRAAGIAAVVCGINPLFLISARSGSPSIFFAAWWLLGIAAALWALRPMRPPPSIARQASGWALSGLAMGMAVLTLGPVSLIPVSFPILLLILLCPNRLSHLMGLVAALFLATLTVLVWAAYAHVQSIDAWALDWWLWLPYNWHTREVLVNVAAERAGLLVAGLFPWTLWLVAGVAQPFSTSSKGVRSRLFLGWGWFVMVLAFLLVTPSIARDAFLVGAAAAAAVLIGEVLNQYVELSQHGKAPRFWRLLRLPHLALLIAGALLIPVALGMMPFAPLTNNGQRVFGDMGWFFGAGLCVALLGIVGLSIRPAFRDFPAQAMVMWALWAAVFLTGLTALQSRGPEMHSNARKDAITVSALVGTRPLYWWGTLKAEPARESPALLLYLGRTVRRLTTDRIEAARQEHGRFYLLTSAGSPMPSESPNTRVLRSIPGSRVMLIECDDAPATTAPAKNATHPVTEPAKQDGPRDAEPSIEPAPATPPPEAKQEP